MEIELEYAPVSGEDYNVMLHQDTNGNGVYEFGPGSTDVDTPVMQNEEVVMKNFTAQ